MIDAALAYSILVLVASLACAAAHGLDKRRAATGGRRVRERTLHLLALSGGWPGGLWAQRRFRHKTRKPAFLLVFWAAAGLHVAAVIVAAYLVFRLG